tara:strand:+ start:780 stop:1589 length:810 start_codon:yes stop_codon:yes gene_type:complete
MKKKKAAKTTHKKKKVVKKKSKKTTHKKRVKKKNLQKKTIVGIIALAVFFSIFFLNQQDVSKNKFVCNNDNSIESRGYVYLHGYGSHGPEQFEFERELIAKDNKVKFIIDYDYDEKKTMTEITNDFIELFNNYNKQVNEIVILAESAGGVIALNSMNKLKYDGVVELHTLASPINGYHVPSFLVGETGFGREIGLGFDKWKEKPNNFRVVHHKTITDSSLKKKCGWFKIFCNPLNIQNNNVKNSEEYFYPNDDHATIMDNAAKLVIECR